MASRRTGGVPSAYANGYTESVRRQLETVSLPEKLKCKTCKKFRNLNAYSKRQLDIFRNALVVHGQRAKDAGYATCRGCTGGQVMELRCCVCDEVKDLGEFANNQRKEHEFARCLVCVQEHKDAEPAIDENRLLTDGNLSATQGTITNAGSIFTGSTRRVTSDGPGYGSSFAGATDNVPSGGGVWVEPERHEMNSIHSGWASYGVQRSEIAASVRSDGGDGKFAKVKAWRPEEMSSNVNAAARARQISKKADFSDEEDDEGDVSDYL
ncbi:hypothetical protein BDW74DRAFT_47255 [Aspergillus multicolor]|uniref:uncharacterized protein n=1 Tax=Aspergillus multicolor TaxID=41759 RepID=UPI003CCDD069